MEVREDRTNEEGLRGWNGLVEGRGQVKKSEKLGTRGRRRRGEAMVEQMENWSVGWGYQSDETT